jgi:Glyoxalase-like domain
MGLPRVDHLIYVTPDLDRGVEGVEKLLGVRASPGGQHPGAGTRNALLALGPLTYLEIMAPDPDQPPPPMPRPFGIDTLRAPRLAAWAARGQDLEQLSLQAARAGVQLGNVLSGSRQRPDGVTLAWEFTNPWTVVADGIVPFFIDWGRSPHPGGSAAKGAALVDLRAVHPDAPRVQEMLRRLGLDLAVDPGRAPALIALIEAPNGRVELR